MAKIRSQLKLGGVYAIPIGDGTFGVGQVCMGNDIAVFRHRLNSMPRVEDIAGYSLMFRVCISIGADRDGNWVYVGDAPLSLELTEYALNRNRPIGSTILWAFRGAEKFRITKEEGDIMEDRTTWSGENIRDRIEAEFHGKNKGKRKALLDYRWEHGHHEKPEDGSIAIGPAY